jgi:hypothetical protein
MHLSVKHGLLVGAACLGAVIPTSVAYLVVGWIGVGIVGLLIASIAVRLEVEQEGPVGGELDATLYATILRQVDHMDRAERSARLAAVAARVRAGNVAKAIGAVLAIIGLAGFFLVQLP